jgi:hypothetical protein
MYEADMLARQSQTPLYVAAVCGMASALVLGATASAAAEEPIIQDAEYYIIEALSVVRFFETDGVLI